jgi:hypothetical protein
LATPKWSLVLSGGYPAAAGEHLKMSGAVPPAVYQRKAYNPAEVW